MASSVMRYWRLKCTHKINKGKHVAFFWDFVGFEIFPLQVLICTLLGRY